MKQKLRVALAQINCTVGDIEGNASKICEYIGKAQSIGADLVSFPELCLTGYPPEDMLHKAKFIADNLKKIKEVAGSVGEIVVVVGFVDRKGKELYNAAAIIYKGRILAVYHKMCLPNYGVFDEKRYFTPGEKSLVFKFGNIFFGVNICEDIWCKNGPTQQEAFCGAKLILNINASPYHMGKINLREKVIAGQAKANKLFMVYTNLVGGQDELVFDGQSMVVNDKGRVIQRLEAFKEELLAVDLE
ncbi:MAG: NAD+ synthase, partial [Candidatus Omnitrophica bacterium]|nr:NAD+ synthase [Candidatus Omnitrophota bacterium]